MRKAHCTAQRGKVMFTGTQEDLASYAGLPLDDQWREHLSQTGEKVMIQDLRLHIQEQV